jgi:hypothetical protein
VSTKRNGRGQFAPKPREELSPGYRRRLERAEAQGKSRAEARGHGTSPRRQWQSADRASKPAYPKVLEVLSRTRRGESLTAASRAVGVAPDTVLRYAGSAFTRENGRWKPKPTDRLSRQMRFLDARGAVPVEPASSKEATKLARYWKAVDRYLKTGDDRDLRRFARMRLRTRQKTSLSFLTDRHQLKRLGYAGELRFEDLYQH